MPIRASYLSFHRVESILCWLVVRPSKSNESNSSEKGEPNFHQLNCANNTSTTSPVFRRRMFGSPTLTDSQHCFMWMCGYFATLRLFHSSNSIMLNLIGWQWKEIDLSTMNGFVKSEGRTVYHDRHNVTWRSVLAILSRKQIVFLAWNVCRRLYRR